MLHRAITKVYSFQLETEFKKFHGIEVVDYRTKRFFQDLCDNSSIYREVRVKDKPKYRFTFPLYFICVLLVLLGMAIRWLFTGDSYYESQSWILRTMHKWKVACRFTLG